MKNKWPDKRRVRVCSWIAVVLVSISRHVVADVTCGTNGCSFPNDVWCATESETFVEGTPQGAPVPHTEILLQSKQCNCNSSTCINPWGPDYLGSVGWSYTSSESVANSCSGSDTMGIGLSVGEAAVGQLNLSYATTLANGWQLTDTYQVTVHQTWNFDVPPSTCQTNTMIGIWEDGTWTGTSHILATANNGIMGSGFNDYTVTCNTSNAKATGSKHYVQINGNFGSVCCNPGQG